LSTALAGFPLFAYAGLRRSELLGNEWDDVDLERRLIHLRNVKGGRQRTVPMHPTLEPLFLDYLRFRGADPEPALLVGTQGGRRLSYRLLSETFGRSARAAESPSANASPAHAPAGVRLGAAARGGEPAPDPGAARAQPPRLQAALHAHHGARAPWRGETAAVSTGYAPGFVTPQLKRQLPSLTTLSGRQASVVAYFNGSAVLGGGQSRDQSVQVIAGGGPAGLAGADDRR
jgi:hypothetical protein